MNADIEACLNLMNECAVVILLDERKRDPLRVTHKVMAYVTAVLVKEHRCPLVDEMADKLNVSAPTLRRHLCAEGHGYQQIIDDLRMEIAKRLLLKGLTVDEVADDLGFSAPPAFSRAFSQWTGFPPSTWRSKAA
jgi:AraC-like DNA-binding protein